MGFNLVISGIIFVLRQVFAYKGNKLKYVFTPLVTAYLVWVLISAGQDTLYTSLMVAVIMFCVVGDICLMDNMSSYFYTGVVSFGIAQALLILNFTIHGTTTDCKFLPIALILGVIFAILNKMTNLYRSDKIMFYYGILLFTALLMSFFNSGLAMAGTILFVSSDLLLLLNKQKPFKHATVYVWMLYSPAILCYVLSAIM